MGLIDSNIRSERKKLWIPSKYETIEEKNYGKILISPKLIKFIQWQIADLLFCSLLKCNRSRDDYN